MFLLPFMVVFVVFRVWPLIQAVEMSFQDVQGLQGNDWVGLENYQRIFANPQFMTAMVNTIVYTVMTLIILIPIPLALSALLDRGRTYKPLAWRIALFLPALASLVVVSFLFRVVLAEDGLLNTALSALGLPPQAWLTSASLAIPSLLIIATWRWVGVNMLYFNSGLVNISRELYEAAAIDGARRHADVPAHHRAAHAADDHLRAHHLGHRRVPAVRRAVPALARRQLAGARGPVRRPAHLPDGVHVLQVR